MKIKYDFTTNKCKKLFAFTAKYVVQKHGCFS